MNDRFFDSASSGNELDLPAFFDSDILDGLIGVISLGVLVSVGLTRDRGALGITILDNGRKRREYFRRSEDACEYLRGAVLALEGHRGSPLGGGGNVRQNGLRAPSERF